MAEPSPWIESFLTGGLLFYLNTTPEARAKVSKPPYHIQSDYTNLRILAAPASQQRIQFIKWQQQQPRKSPTAEVTDGQIRINAVFASYDHKFRKSENFENRVDITHNAVLLLETFELRVTDVTNPPRVELCISTFDISGCVAPLPDPGILPDLHTHGIVNKLLRKWKQRNNNLEAKEIEASKRQTMIRSQQSSPVRNTQHDRGDNQYANPALQSQIGFATQISISPKATTVNKDKRPQQVNVAPAHHSNQSLLNELALHRADDEQSSVPPNAAAHTAPIRTPPTEPSGLIASEVDLPTSSHAALHEPKVNTIPRESSQELEESKDAVTPGITDRVKTEDPIPEQLNNSQNLINVRDDIREQFREWRRECHNGRYIPRRVQLIPQDQQQLLGSDDSWQPSLVGRPQRLGTVPLSLLNRLSERADSLATQETPHAILQTDQAVESVEIEQESSVAEDVVEDAPSQASDTSEEIVEDWSVSPPEIRPRSNLPADSPIGGQNRNYLSEAPVARPSAEDEMEKNDSHLVAPLSQTAENVHHPSRARKNTNLGQNLDDKMPSINEMSVLDGTRESGQEVTAQSENAVLSVFSQNTVHVKDTPFVVRNSPRKSEVPNTSTFVVPGTFDDRRARYDEGDFENNSSEDDAGHRYEARLKEDARSQHDTLLSERVRCVDELIPAHNTGDDERQSSEAHATANPSGSNNSKATSAIRTEILKTPLSSTKRPQKRTNLNFDSSEQVTASKRAKFDQSSPFTAAHDQSYTSLDKRRARARQHFYQSLKKNGAARPKNVSQIRASSELNSESGDGSSELQEATRTFSPPEQQRLPTSETRTSIHRTSSQDYGRSKPSTVFPLASTQDIDPTTRIFADFQTTYPDYRAPRGPFDAACRLLQELCSRSKAPHPSLWDDFIFRHFYDYQQYLRRVQESYGNAVSYETFYEMYVEEPTHMKRVIRPAHLELLSETNHPSRTTTYSILPTTLPELTRTKVRTTADPDSSFNLKRTLGTSISHTPLQLSQLAEKSKSRPALEGRPLSSFDRRSLDPVRHQPPEPMLVEADNSQDSTTSVKLWLERAAGAESPVLGTPPGLTQATQRQQQHNDIPIIDLDDLSSPPPHPQSTSSPLSISYVTSRSNAIKGTDKVIKALGVDTKEEGMREEKDEPWRAEEVQQHDTVFRCFAGNYANLAIEKWELGRQVGDAGDNSTNRGPAASQIIDIFSWRKN